MNHAIGNQQQEDIVVLYRSPETLLPIKCMANTRIVKLYNLKTFLVGGCYVKKTCTITVLGYLHQQVALSDSKLITEFKKNFAEYYVASAILYREVPHMVHAKYQQFGPN